MHLPDGLHLDIPMVDYLAITDRASTSVLHSLQEDGAALAREKQLNPNHTTSATNIGTGVHEIVVEPENFIEHFTCFEGEKRTKEAKARWQAILDSGKVPLREKEWELVRRISKAVRRHRGFQHHLSSPDTLREVTALHGDLRCRPDVYDPQESVIIDIKTTRDLRSFRRDIVGRGYYMGAAIQVDVIKMLTGVECRFAWYVIEKHDTLIQTSLRWADDYLEAGRTAYSDLLNEWRRCRDADDWPTREDGDEVAPDWLVRQQDGPGMGTFGSQDK